MVSIPGARAPRLPGFGGRDLAAELVALAYKYRWQVEIFHPHCPSSAGLYHGRRAA